MICAATVAWGNQAVIDAFYIESKRLTLLTGVKHEVDHVYPLQGRLVCGLHVEWNMRVVPSVENRRKSYTHPTDTGDGSDLR